MESLWNKYHKHWQSCFINLSLERNLGVAFFCVSAAVSCGVPQGLGLGAMLLNTILFTVFAMTSHLYP